MSLPITYWDMLGWKDTLASEANTRRQKAYAEAMGRGGVYTPQMIIDGVTDVVGSRESAVEAAIEARNSDLQAISVSLGMTPQELHIAIGSGRDHGGQAATIWMFHILGSARVNVSSGENAGRSLVYRNVVRDVRAIGIWKGQAMSLDLPRAGMMGALYDAIAVVVQQGGYGRVIGAAMMEQPRREE